MATKDEEQIIEQQPSTTPEATEEQPEAPKKAKKKEKKEGKQSLYQKLKLEAKEGDDKPSGSLRLRDILGGDHLISLVRKQLGLIVMIVVITTVYVAYRYQCQQDTIDINQLETEVLDAKYKALSSSSKLTEISRQSNVLQVLRQHNDTLLQPSKQPPFNIFIPVENK